MGLTSSTCKRKKQNKIITIINDKYTQTVNTLPNMRDSSSYRCYRHMSSRYHMQRCLVPSLHSTTFNKSTNIISHHPNPYVAKGYNRITDRTDPSRLPSLSNIVNNPPHHKYRASIQVKSLSTLDTVEQSNQQNMDTRSRLIERSTSIPMDMFLIDISNKQVSVGQPVSMNIRHLCLKVPDENHKNSSILDRTKLSSTTTEKLLEYIPNACKKYPNLTVNSNQSTHNTLHTHLPPQFSHTKT